MGRHGWRDDAALDAGEDPSAADDALAPWDRPGWGGDQPGDPSRRVGRLRRWGLRGCLILVLASAAVLGFRLASGQAQVSSLAVPPVAGPGADARASGPVTASRSGPDGAAMSTAEASGAPPRGTPAAAESPAAAGPTVHVVGAVKRPGLYRLAAGARVDDAVRAAGGAEAGAALAALNLAAPLTDGTQLHVPGRGEAAVGPYAAQGAAPPGDGAAPAPGAARVPAAPSSAPVRINTASQAELEALPGVGPALAQRIIAFRDSHGRLQGEQDLDAVPGIGPAMLEKLRGVVSYD